MIEVKKEGILLKTTGFEFESEGVLNPAAIRDGAFVHLFYRAVRKGNHSTIGYCKMEGPLTIIERRESPVMAPEFGYESQGVEDPRIVQIDELYYLSYVAYDGINAMGALATSTDLVHFDKKGVIVPQLTYEEFKPLVESHGHLNQKYGRYNARNDVRVKADKSILVWDKNVVFFPRRINGKFYFLHRIKPDIQIACVNELAELTRDYWIDYLLHIDKHIALCPKHAHEVSYIGSGCPPIETEKGWLVIYHGVHDALSGYVYSACAALLDLQNPEKEIARLPYPLFQPVFDWEKKGEVNNVVFPTGTALFEDTLYIYYGAADTQIATASLSLTALLKELLLYIGPEEKCVD
jgi:predicted GH43/DUF377 family glycosyl hydrolase